jgi:hypothetical protein
VTPGLPGVRWWCRWERGRPPIDAGFALADIDQPGAVERAAVRLEIPLEGLQYLEFASIRALLCTLKDLPHFLDY